jgi:endonuclease/exonuclease/phosphatase family metal-dependent hydrolase
MLVLVIGWLFLPPFYKISSKNSSLNDDLKVMSYNVKTFDLFINKKDTIENINGYTFIKDKNPDILAVQEFYKSKKIKISFPYKYIKTKNDKSKFGLAIYSKFSIVNQGSLNLTNTSNNIIFADIVIKKDTVRVYNLHLQSLSISPEKENFGQENSEKLINNLKKRFKLQANQTEQFLAHQQQWKGKKIICGDFNNTAYSWVYKQISENNKDAFIEAGKGFGKTYTYWFPMRIDFILTDETAVINQFNSFSEAYSDHFPIQARVNW